MTGALTCGTTGILLGALLLAVQCTGPLLTAKGSQQHVTACHMPGISVQLQLQQNRNLQDHAESSTV